MFKQVKFDVDFITTTITASEYETMDHKELVEILMKYQFLLWILDVDYFVDERDIDNKGNLTVNHNGCTITFSKIEFKVVSHETD